ncbi:MAG: HEAT repeat domain-containing protein [Candidatus Wallbacteria bacterium]|nr:HEAT repeat domain-containing protein [Candidatus Wallbacteria bacterium]
MTARLARLFDLRSGEESLFGWLFAYNLLWGVALALGGAACESLFIKGWGVGWLPLFFIAGDLLVMAAAAGYGRLSRKLAPAPLLALILLVFTATGGLATAAFVAGASTRSGGAWMSLVAYLLFYALVEVGFLHFFNFQRRYFDVQQAKRLLPRVLGGFNVGYVVGGLGVVFLLHFANISTLLAGWTVSLAAAYGSIRMLDRRVRPLAEPSTLTLEDSKPPSLKELVSYPLAVWVLVFTMISVLTMRFFEYQSNAIFTRSYPSSEELAVFYGTFGAAARAAALLMQLAVMPWLIRLFGLARSGVVYPLVACASGTALALAPGVFPAMGARFCHTCLVYTVTDPLLNLLAGGLPTALADRLNVVAMGWVMRFSTVAASLSLLGMIHTGRGELVGTVSLVLGWTLLLWVLPLKRLYSRAVLDTLRGGRASGALIERIDPSELPAAFSQELEHHARSSERAVAAMAVELLARSRDPASRQFLTGLVGEPGPSELKAQILASLPADDSVELRRLIESGLTSADARVSAAALAALGRLEGPRAEPRIMPFLHHQEPELRAVAANWLVGHAANDTRAAELFPQLLADPSPTVVRAALDAYVERRPAYGFALVTRTTAHKDPAVRAAALKAASIAGRFEAASVVPLADLMIEDSSALVRLAAVRSLAEFPGAEAAARCAKALGDPSRSVARHSASALLHMDQAGVDAAWSVVTSNAAATAARHNALGVLAGARQPELLWKAGQAFIERGLRLSVLRGDLGADPASAPEERWLASTLEERLRDCAVLGAHVVALLKEPSVYGIMERRLTSLDMRLLAYALEALVNMGEKQLTPQIQLLLEARNPSERAAAARRHLGTAVPGAIEVSFEALSADGDPFLLAGWLALASHRGWSVAPERLQSHPHPLVRECYELARRAA